MLSHIGKYQIVSELGRGGFGRVFRAYDPSVGREVAIKVILPGDDAEQRHRFHSEAATAGRLLHPNIVQIFDLGESDGAPYIVMELLEGKTLQQLIREPGRMGLLEKTEIIRQVARGLDHANSRGV